MEMSKLTMNNDKIQYYCNQALRRLHHPDFLDKWTEVNDNSVEIYFKIDKEGTINYPIVLKKSAVVSEIKLNQLLNTIIIGLKELFLKFHDLDINDLEFSDYYD